MSDANSHLDNISVAITLDSAPVAQAGFGAVTLLVNLATNSLNGADYVVYENYADAVADQVAGYISASTLAAVATAFSQRPQPSSFQVAPVDVGGGDTYAVGLAAAIAAGASVYAVCMDSRTAADQVILAAATEAADAQFAVLQSADADWLTTGFPAAFSTIDGNEKCAVVYHDTATVWDDVAWAVNRLAFDPDTQSVPWDCPLKGVSALATAPTSAQKAYLKANCNVALPYGGENYFIDPGQNCNGRPIYEVLTADWFETRLVEQVSALKARLSARGEKLPCTAAGQASVLGIINRLFEQGVDAGHFVAGQTAARGLAISSADLTAQRLRFSGEAQMVTSGRVFSFNFNFGLDPLASA